MSLLLLQEASPSNTTPTTGTNAVYSEGVPLYEEEEEDGGKEEDRGGKRTSVSICIDTSSTVCCW